MEKVCNSCITHTDITKLKVTTARVENFSYAWLRTFFWFVLVFKTPSLDQCEQEELQFKQVFFPAGNTQYLSPALGRDTRKALRRYAHYLGWRQLFDS